MQAPSLKTPEAMASRWDRDTQSGRVSGVASADDGPVEGQDGSTLLLRASGSLMEVRSPLTKRIELNGLMRVIRNFPQRNKEWAFSCSCANERTGEMSLADERGQVYVMSPADNVYRSVRLASSPVSCLGFVTSSLNEIVIAYESGVVVVIDSQKKAIVGNLQQVGSSPIRMIRSSPTKPAVILVSDERVVSFWNMSKMRCIKSFECDEPVVDVRFEAGGAIVALTLAQSGLYLHRAVDFALLQRCPLPAVERNPARWLAYASHSLVVPSATTAAAGGDAPPPPKAKASQSLQPSEFQLRLLLTADNGMIYVWDAAIPRASLSASESSPEARRANLVGVVELPVTMQRGVVMAPLAHRRFSSRQARVLVLSDAGELVLIEIEDGSSVSLGTWAVTLAMSSELLFGPGASKQSVHPFAVGLPEAVLPIGEGDSLPRPVLDGVLSAQGDLFLAVGADGAARLFDADCALGLGELSGSVLRCRSPYAHASKRPDYWSQIQDIKASYLAPAAASAKKTYAALQASSEAKASGLSYPWSAAATAAAAASSSVSTAAKAPGDSLSASQQFNRASAESTATEDDMGPLPPYMSSSITSGTFAAALAAEGGGSVSASVTSLIPSSTKQTLQPSRGGDSPKGPSRQGVGVSFGERGVQLEMSRQQQMRDARQAEEDAAVVAAKYEEQRVKRDAVEAAQAAKVAERQARAKAKADAAAARRDAKLARQEKLRAEGISARAVELFQLASLSPAEREDNVKKLRGFLEVHGEFPTKYRNLIWRFLLQLPENVTAASDLRSKGTHPSFLLMLNEHPLPDVLMGTRLQSLCSQLSHWSPVLSEAAYLPQLTFPFAVQFANDDLSALESVVSIMMWWGHTWMTSFPSSPIHIVETIDALVMQHDTKLRYHFSRVQGVTAGQLGWAMMSTAFSEVLCRADWLKLMDFLFAHFRHPGYFVLAPVAVLRNLSTSLLATDKADVMSLFCRRLQGIDVADVIADIKGMFATTPKAKLAVLVPRRLTETGQEITYGEMPAQSKAKKGGRDEDDDDEEDDVTDEDDSSDFGDEGLEQMRRLEMSGAAELAREDGTGRAGKQQGSAVFPLPKSAQYPIYDCFPSHVLDWQLRERSHENALHAELHRKEHLLRALTVKTAEVKAEHEAWMSRHGHAADAESRRKVETMAKEVLHMRELLKMEEAISTQRVEALTVLEQMAEEELTLLDTASDQAKALIDASEEHLAEKATLALSMARHRELAEEAEATTEDRIRTLQLRRSRDERLKSLSSAVKAKEQELDAKDAVLTEAWRRQDEESARSRRERALRAKEMLEEEVLGGLQDAMQARMRKLVMEREAKLVEVERARAVRLAKERTDEALEAAERSGLLMQKQELAAATEKAAQLAAAGHKMTQDMLMVTADRIRDEAGRLVEAERVHAMRQNKARLAAQSANMEREWAEKQTKLMVGVLSSEQELQEQRLRMARASAETEAEEALIMEQQRVLAEARAAGPGANLEALGERVMSQQRARFEEMLKNLSGSGVPRM